MSADLQARFLCLYITPFLPVRESPGQFERRQESRRRGKGSCRWQALRQEGCLHKFPIPFRLSALPVLILSKACLVRSSDLLLNHPPLSTAHLARYLSVSNLYSCQGFLCFLCNASNASHDLSSIQQLARLSVSTQVLQCLQDHRQDAFQAACTRIHVCTL